MAWTWDNLGKRDERLLIHTDTWTGDSSTLTDPLQQPAQLLSIAIHYADDSHNDASITNNATVTIDAITGANYDHLITTFENAGGETDNYGEYSKETMLQTGDRIMVTCDVGSDNAYITIKVVLS